MKLKVSEFPLPYHVYVARYVYERHPDGVRKCYLSLEKQCGTYSDFSLAFPRMNAIKRDILAVGGKEVLSSRDKGFCIDQYLVPLGDGSNPSEPLDCDMPGMRRVEVIATVHQLQLAD